ncbi:hypothetical protein Q31b_51160 [Novipirellula aureliae]|uniref:Uncharacterized protein n=1 Tax=Novipirellula aureliae TaxID=2527966 RepID=A0A5C6DJC2_9BACT|nr:hypothetical protein [Novipirellula aureliae]TWU35681.1 hypothetical protein Q31b_51160 [Novipirellula aureliae]
MTNSQRLAVVRNHLSRWIAGVSGRSLQENGDSGIVSESMLIRDGFFCGRCFQANGFRAVWFMEEDELKIYADDGKLQRVFSGTEITASAENQVVKPETGRERILTIPQQQPEEEQQQTHRRAA